MLDTLVKKLQDLNNLGKNTRYIRWLKDISESEKDKVGKKAYYQGKLLKRNYLVPNGFVILPLAFTHYLEQNRILSKIDNLLNLCISEPEKISEYATIIQRLILNGYVPESIKDEVYENYNLLGTVINAEKLLEQPKTELCIRISTDVPISKPFQLTFLKLQKKDIFEATKTIWASMFLEENIKKNIKSLQNLINVGVLVQEMIEHIRAGKIEVTNGLAKIEGIKGYGIYLSQKDASTNQYIVDLKTLKILSISVPGQTYYYTYDPLENKIVKINTSYSDQVFTDSEIRDLAYMAKRLCLEFRKTANIEFVVSDESVYIVDFNPKDEDFSEESLLEKSTATEIPETKQESKSKIEDEELKIKENEVEVFYNTYLKDKFTAKSEEKSDFIASSLKERELIRLRSLLLKTYQILQEKIPKERIDEFRKQLSNINELSEDQLIETILKLIEAC
ncbi:MAG: PEP/pyruvate-binding domain-containing protein [Candidatus Woesearchaeota archaeon]